MSSTTATTPGGQTEVTRASVGLRSERGPILLSLMMATSLVALDSTILATAVPAIVKDLGGFTSFPWLFSAYLLAQAIAVPIYGRLSDVFGRKPVMLFWIALFLIGSLLSGLAWSMPALIVFRAVQGLGAGAILPVSITIAGDLYSLRERAKVQGYLASVWGVSSVVGPVLGGVFSDFLSWRWIFFVNIPLALIAAAILLRNFTEQVDRREQEIDYAGAMLLGSSTGLLILGLLEGGQGWAWNSGFSIGIFAAAAILLVVFVLVERRVAQPILPLWVFQRRVLLVSSLVSAGVGAIILGLSSYLPTYGQQVLGASALLAGLALAALTVGWPIAASLSGRIYLAIGFRGTALIGGVVVLIGSALTLLLDSRSPLWEVALFCLIIGLGMGLVASPTLIAAQSSVEWGERGVVTGSNMFARSIGSAVGVAVFGAIVNAASGGRGAIPSPDQLVPALHTVFLTVLALAAATLIAIAFMPRHQGHDEPQLVVSSAESPG